MKKILFPATNRNHLARQQILLNKLKEHFEVHIATYGEKEMSMTEVAVDITNKFKKGLDTIKPDLVLIRGDRFELLPCAMLSTYDGYKVAQIEAGDLSGIIDNKVRYAISHLSDIHFATNQESEERLKKMGFNQVYNYGSLDIEYTLKVSEEASNSVLESSVRPFIMVLWHNVPDEDEKPLQEALEVFKEKYDIIGLKGNRDYGIASSYKEEYKPKEFINLLAHASCLIGNSSAGIKEASILGTPVVDIGSRQMNRLKPKNVFWAGWDKYAIQLAIYKQLHNRYEPDYTYYNPKCSDLIVKTFLDFF